MSTATHLPILKSPPRRKQTFTVHRDGNQHSLAEKKQIPTPASQRVDFLVGPTTGGGPGNIPSFGFLCNWLSTAQCGFVVPYGFCMFIKQAASCLSAVWGRLRDKCLAGIWMG